MSEHRVFVGWSKGGYISTLSPDFHAGLQEMVAALGRPDVVEFRADGEGWEGRPPDPLRGAASPAERACQKLIEAYADPEDVDWQDVADALKLAREALGHAGLATPRV